MVQKRGFQFLADSSGIEPPDDFTELNVIPSLTDIISEHTSQFLRKNITNGAYQNVSHYLDVQFRLLREDFLQPLRDGVQKFRHIIQEARFNNRLITRKNEQDQLTKEVTRNISNIESLSVYFDCAINDSVLIESGIAYQVHLSEDKVKSINWDSSKKLLFGSLVCLSNDFFENTCIVGSICDRDSEKLKKGIVTVKFNLDAETHLILNQLEFSGNFIMLETSAFFESYKHVLKALVSFRRDGEENFPFRENLVYCQNKSMPIPKYLSNIEFNLSTLLSENNELNRELKSKASKCYASNPEAWPNADQMGLDSSQYEAV